jgi:hypothetical protein
MHKAVSFIKTQLKYSTLLIGIIIFMGQIYYGFIKSEEDLKSISSLENKNEKNEDKCSSSPSDLISKIMMIIFKCSLAFLAGGLFSDMKFIKFGVI